MNIPLAKPYITRKEAEYVIDALTTGILSIGPFIERFENAISKFTEIKHAVAVNSGTSALHLVIRAYGIADGDEVITTPFSFIASANCILFERATPVFVDIDPLTFNIDVNKIEAKITKKTKAILAVDAFGQPVDIVSLRKIADKHNLILIEDSAESLGSSYQGHVTGSLADAAIYAFYPNKQITTAEGGLVVTNDDKIADLCRSMRSQGRAITGSWLHHEMLGYNYRLSELHAALGLAQMERIEEILPMREEVANYYYQGLKNVDWLELPYIDKKVSFMSWFVFVISVKNGQRDRLMEYLEENKIGCKPYFTPIYTQPFYKEMFGFKEGDFPETDSAGERCLAIPFYTAMTKEEQDYVIQTIKEFKGNVSLTEEGI